MQPSVAVLVVVVATLCSVSGQFFPGYPFDGGFGGLIWDDKKQQRAQAKNFLPQNDVPYMDQPHHDSPNSGSYFLNQSPQQDQLTKRGFLQDTPTSPLKTRSNANDKMYLNYGSNGFGSSFSGGYGGVAGLGGSLEW